MRYLRMLSNSVVAALLTTCYVLIVILQLNPGLPLHPVRLVPLAVTMGPFYVVHLTAAYYALLVVRQLLARELFSPAWVSVSVLSWLSALAASAGAALMWANARTFALVLEPDTARRMTSGAVAVAAAAALFAIVAISKPRVRSGPRVVAAFCLAFIAAGSAAAPMVLRGRGVVEPLAAHPIDMSFDASVEQRTARVSIIAVDAASLELVTHAAAEGRLPNFGRILDAGAVMHLATLHPTSSEAVWAAVATGKLPQKNGVRSANVYRLADREESIRLLPDFCYASGLLRFGFLSEEPHTSAALRSRTLWSMLSTQGVSVGVVNWPLTHPAPPVRGFVVSDVYVQLALTPTGLADRSILYPPELEAETIPLLHTSTAEPPSVVPPGLEVEIGERHQSPGRVDGVYDRLSDMLQSSRPTQVRVVRYGSLDPVGHYFLRYAMPSRFGNVTEDERRRLGTVLERHYGLIDEAIGRAIAVLGPDDLLMVVSGYGMEPLGFAKRVLEQVLGDPEISGSHEAAPDGFLMAYGAKVQKARLLPRASVVDVAPTVLYYLGLPIGRDLDGNARTDLFQPAFTEALPITFIPSYER